MYEFKSNELIEAVLYNENKIKSYINYRILLWKIKRSTPDYNTFLTIYDFIDQLNFAYFHNLDESNSLFIYETNSKKENRDKSLIYKDSNVKIVLFLKPNNTITLHITRNMGYKQTSITFSNGEVNLQNKLEEQLFINCTNLIMNELYRMVKKYRDFGRI